MISSNVDDSNGITPKHLVQFKPCFTIINNGLSCYKTARRCRSFFSEQRIENTCNFYREHFTRALDCQNHAYLLSAFSPDIFRDLVGDGVLRAFQSSIIWGTRSVKASHNNDRFHGRPSGKGNLNNPRPVTIPNIPPKPLVSPTERSTL